MTQLSELMDNALWNLSHRLGLIDLIDIIIVAAIIYEVMKLTRRTRGGSVIKGVFLFLLCTGLSSLFQLTSLNWLLTIIATNGVMVLIILFQPELRKGLEQLGRNTTVRHSRFQDEAEERERIISEIMLTLKDLSRRKVGVLIVFERKTGLQDVIETGTALNARISAPLLENVFEPNTPLHDGAVIIRGSMIMAGACILPLTEDRGVSRELGTRHRAGLGISESTDAMVLIVSEETGTISMADEGKLHRPMGEKALRAALEKFYTPPKSGLAGFLERHSGEEEW